MRESSFTFGTCGTCERALQVTTLGMIENHGEHSWTNVHFEVRYFDEAGRLIDTVSWKDFALVVSAGGEAAFRVRGAAARPREQYASHEVVVKHADDLDAWP